MDSKKLEKIDYLFYRYSDGSITKEEMELLNLFLLKSESVQDRYIAFLKTEIAISHCLENNSLVGGNTFHEEESCDEAMDSGNALVGVDIKDVLLDEQEAAADKYGLSEDSNFMQAMRELAECERTAPTVVIEKAKAAKPRPEIRAVDHSIKWHPGKVNKFSLCAAVIMGAAFLSMLGYVHFMPAPVDPPVVAELIDSIEAEWDKTMQLPGDLGEMRQTAYRLKKGYASILFNNGAKITVEAPTDLSLLSIGDMELLRGSIYAVVPERAHGFSVKAGDNKIVDLGTEFGVEIDKNNNTQVHVTKGEVLLFSGGKNSKKPPVNVKQGAARQVDIAGIVRNIGVASEKFVRRINSEMGVIFNGQYSFVDTHPLAGRHDDFYVSADPSAEKGVTVSIYSGAYDAKIDYDSLTPAATAIYNFGASQEPGFPTLSKSGEITTGYHFEKNQAFVARGYIELPESGKYIFRSGWEHYSYNVMELDGRQVYRRNMENKKPVQRVVDIVAGKRYPVKITFFGGGGSGFWAYRVE